MQIWPLKISFTLIRKYSNSLVVDFLLFVTQWNAIFENWKEYGDKIVKAPFSLSAEQRNRITYSESPLSISTFISRLNSMRPDASEMEKLPAGW